MRLIAWCCYKLFRLNLHFDLGLYKRWKWKKYFLKGNIKTLEIGPGIGSWTFELLKRGNRVTCVDVNPKVLQRLKKLMDLFCIPNDRITLINKHVKDLSLEHTYDQIILFEVLEHIIDDQYVINKLANFLKKGGQILISTPNNELSFSQKEKIILKEDGGHVRAGYSFTDLEKLLKNAGLIILFRDNCAGFFTQRAISFLYKLTDRFHLNKFFLIPFNLISRPVTWFDCIYPKYSSYVNFVIAKK